MDRNSFGTDFKFIWHLSPSEGPVPSGRRRAVLRKQPGGARAVAAHEAAMVGLPRWPAGG